MRPGWLYFSIFTWAVLTGGRFTAPFLKDIAQFDDSLIGVIIAIQSLLGSLLGSVGAVYADRLEFKYPNKGRMGFLGLGVLFGTISFEIHWLVHLLVQDNRVLSTGLHITARILYSVCLSIVFPILDGITLSYLTSHNCDAAAYGKERSIGAVGWALAHVIIGPVLDKVGFSIFFCTAPLGALLCLTTFAKYLSDSVSYESLMREDIINPETEMVGALTLEHSSETRNTAPETNLDGQDAETDEEERNIDIPGSENKSLSLLWSMVSSCTACGFIISAMTLNMGTSVVESLIFLFFESLGGSYAICGLSVVVTVVFEIPIFHYAPRLLAYFGAEALQKIACLAYITRVVGYTYIPKDHMALVLFFEPLHGVTYACSKTSAVEFAAKLTPKGYEASVQGLLSMMLGIGSVVGLSLGGWIEDSLGPVVLYRSYAGIVAVGLAIFYVTIFVDNKKRNEPKYAHLSVKSSEDDMQNIIT